MVLLCFIEVYMAANIIGIVVIKTNMVEVVTGGYRQPLWHFTAENHTNCQPAEEGLIFANSMAFFPSRK